MNHTNTSNILILSMIHLNLDGQHDDNLNVDGQHEHARAQERDARGAHAVKEAEVQPEKSTLTAVSRIMRGKVMMK